MKDTVNDKKKATVSWERHSFRKNGVFGDGCDFVKPLAYSSVKTKFWWTLTMGRMKLGTYTGMTR